MDDFCLFKKISQHTDDVSVTTAAAKYLSLLSLRVTAECHTGNLRDATLPFALGFSVHPAVPTPCVADEDETAEGEYSQDRSSCF